MRTARAARRRSRWPSRSRSRRRATARAATSCTSSTRFRCPTRRCSCRRAIPPCATCASCGARARRARRCTRRSGASSSAGAPATRSCTSARSGRPSSRSSTGAGLRVAAAGTNHLGSAYADDANGGGRVRAGPRAPGPGAEPGGLGCGDRRLRCPRRPARPGLEAGRRHARRARPLCTARRGRPQRERRRAARAPGAAGAPDQRGVAARPPARGSHHRVRGPAQLAVLPPPGEARRARRQRQRDREDPPRVVRPRPAAPGLGGLEVDRSPGRADECANSRTPATRRRGRSDTATTSCSR